MNKIALAALLSVTTATALAQNASLSSSADQGSELQEIVVTGTLIRGCSSRRFTDRDRL